MQISRDAQPGLDAPTMLAAGVDPASRRRPCATPDVQRGGVRFELVDQSGGARISR